MGEKKQNCRKENEKKEIGKKMRENGGKKWKKNCEIEDGHRKWKNEKEKLEKVIMPLGKKKIRKTAGKTKKI